MSVSLARPRRAALSAILAGIGCLLGGLGATDTAAAAAPVRFTTDSPAVTRARSIAVAYWSVSPCSGVVAVRSRPLERSVNAVSAWTNPRALFGNAAANGHCTITLNQAETFDWPKFCTIMVHEMGHLAGHQHSPDPASVMHATYVAPIPQCKASANTSARAAGKANGTGRKGSTHRRHRAARR